MKIFCKRINELTINKHTGEKILIEKLKYACSVNGEFISDTKQYIFDNLGRAICWARCMSPHYPEIDHTIR